MFSRMRQHVLLVKCPILHVLIMAVELLRAFMALLYEVLSLR